MSIRQRILTLVTLALLALIGVGGVAVFQAAGSEREVRLVTEGVVPSAVKSVELVNQLKDVQISLQELLVADPSLMAQGRDTLFQRRDALKAALDAQVALADSTAQRGLVQQAQEALDNYFGSINDVVQFKLAGQKELAEATMSATTDQYLRELSGLMQTLQIEKTRSKDVAIEVLNANLSGTKAMLGVISVIALVGLALIGWILYRQIVLPIGEMERKMTHIARSHDYTQGLPVTRQDEIGRSIIAFNEMIEQIRLSSELVRQKTAEIQTMLHAIPQGILMVQPGGTLHAEHSQHSCVVLGRTDLAGQPVMDVVFAGATLGEDLLAQVDAAIAACLGEDEMNFEFNAHLLPAEVARRREDGSEQILDLNWSPMVDEHGVVERLLLCLRDVTELRALARAAEGQRRELSMIGEILAVRHEKFHAFVDGSRGLLAQSAALVERSGSAPEDTVGVVGLLFRHLHTVKGNARTHGLRQLTDVVHRVESACDEIRQGRAGWDAELLTQGIAEASAVLEEYARLNEDTLGRRGPGRRGDVETHLLVHKDQVQRLQRQVERLAQEGVEVDGVMGMVKALGTERLEDIVSGPVEALPALAAELGKAAPVTTVDDGGLLVRRQVASVLRDAFMHLYRNAVDHGLEPAAQRQAQGKAEAGRIELRAELEMDQVVMRLRDDGRGIDLARILDKARAAGLVDDQAPGDDAVAEFIFHAGLSTAAQVTEVSGRGVGMDAVRAAVRAEGGDVRLVLGESLGEGRRAFVTELRLPAAFFVLTGSRQGETLHV